MKRIKKYSNGLGYPTMPGMSEPSSNLPGFNVGDQVLVSPFDWVGRVIDRASDGDQQPYRYMIQFDDMGTGVGERWFPHGMLSLVKVKQ